jgi:actin beta/gamma 1
MKTKVRAGSARGDTVVVIDNGSHMMRAGFAGTDAPACAFPTILGRLKHATMAAMLGSPQLDVYVGDEYEARRGVLTPTYPIPRR